MYYISEIINLVRMLQFSLCRLSLEGDRLFCDRGRDGGREGDRDGGRHSRRG